jgi:putative transposase
MVPFMARKPRIHVPGGVYHVILRGNGGQPIFFGEGDHGQMEDLIADGVRRLGYRVHGYCRMPNHVHLIVQVGRIGLSAIVQNLAFRYTRWVNRHQRRRGHLFQGRYQAILVDADSYLLELVRYVHLNPVRAGLVADPAAYPHSGHRAYLGQTDVPWLHREWVLGQFADTEGAARRLYRRFIERGLAEGHRADLYQGAADSRILGDDHFAESIERSCQRPLRRRIPIGKIVAVGAEAMGIELDRLCSPSRDRALARARALLAYVVVTHGCSTLTALSRIVHRDVATLSNGAAMVRERLAEDPVLQERATTLEQRLQIPITQ